MRRIGTVAKFALAALGITLAQPALAQDKVMTITATEPMTTDNPYGDSSSPVYSLWCHTYGCLGRYDYTTKQLVGILAEKWEAIDPTHLALYLAQGAEASRRRSRTRHRPMSCTRSSASAPIRKACRARSSRW